MPPKNPSSLPYDSASSPSLFAAAECDDVQGDVDAASLDMLASEDMVQAAGYPRRVSVCVPLPISKFYDYLLPADVSGAAEIPVGTVVRVPVGHRLLWGVIWGEGDDSVAESRLRPVAEISSVPPLSLDLLKFIEWVAAYTLSPMGMVMRMVLNVPAALEALAPVMGLLRAEAWPEDARKTPVRKTPARKLLWDAAAGQAPMSATELAQHSGVGVAVVRAFAACGGFLKVPMGKASSFSQPIPDARIPVFNDAQQIGVEDLRKKARGGFSVTMLDGVTGSGKTEVYFEAIAEVLRAGRQALVLVPEIALTGQWLDRFEARFGVPPAVWHSELGTAKRRDTWRAVANGEVKVLVGARSGVFLPFADLGLIIVDEEHEHAFKQEDGVIYQGRDMAVVRGQIGDLPVVLASATPSLETLANAKAGRYSTVHLPTRHGGAEMPSVTVVDMKETPPEKQDMDGVGGGRSWLAPPLVHAISETLAKGEQVLLYLNRRGYAPLTICQRCGHRLQCPQCTSWLVEHRYRNGGGYLGCHHCGHTEDLAMHCPSCDAEDSFVACGPGVERVAEEVQHRFPDARRLILSSDHLQGPEALRAALRSISERQVDVVIGTQMVAKGHHFPNLTLVGVVDSDLGLAGGDLRAAERTYQVLHQVAGRAGRGHLPGRVLMQTYDPDQPVIAALAAGDREAFISEEQNARRVLGMPPFGRLAAIIVASQDEEQAAEVAAHLGQAFHAPDGVRLYGPAPAILTRLRGWVRYRLLVQAPREIRLQPILRKWLSEVKIPRSAKIKVDIDPYNFM
jgi:primosomal protein N' (replication factor Y)